MTDPIDAAAFANLVEMTGGELDFVDDLVDTFLADGASQLAAMRTALAAGDVETLTRAAHSMKSGSLNVGALELGGLCRELEEAGRTGSVADGASQIASIAAALEAARRDLLDERERRAQG
jgi:HPt (histidine-containing phosphotransfer) domain-containing protein